LLNCRANALVEEQHTMITRRQMLKTTAVAGGAAALIDVPGVDVSGEDGLTSPRIEPFATELTIRNGGIPEVLQALPGPLEGMPTFTDGVPTKYYQISMRPNDAEIVRGKSTKVWGYDGMCPGPTIMAELDPQFIEPTMSACASTGARDLRHDPERVVVRFWNWLCEDGVPHPAECHHVHDRPLPPLTSIHHHGGHTTASADGYPVYWFGRGQYRDYVYPNTSTRSGTLWYHDHGMDETGRNVYMGLAGFYLLTSRKEEALLRNCGIVLPKGPAVRDGNKFFGNRFDVPLVLQDRVLEQDPADSNRYNLVYTLFNHDGYLGDTFLVNGKAQPRLRVEARRYRFRVLNGSNARLYGLELASNGGRVPFVQIGSDGGLLPKAVQVGRNTDGSRPRGGSEYLKVSPAERMDIVVDFTGMKGRSVYLLNVLEQTNGRGPDGVFDPGGEIPLMRFDVVDPDPAWPDDSRVPRHLEPLLPLITKAEDAEHYEEYAPEDARNDNGTDASPGFALPLKMDDSGLPYNREYRLQRSHGLWLVNDDCFDYARNDADPPVVLGTTEIWRLVNTSGGWVHPLHIHLEEFRILSKNGVAPPPGEQGLKDTFLLGPNDVIRVITKFRDQHREGDGHNDGYYVFHCHNLEHEDMAMMGNWKVVVGDPEHPGNPGAYQTPSRRSYDHAEAESLDWDREVLQPGKPCP
jgi:FtsP/CotA-like multicopper oxidase with cupredoxin domain